MKQVKRIGKRATSAFMAFVITFVTVVTISGGVFVAKYLAAPAQSILSLPINDGDSATSPNYLATCWGNDDAIINGSGIFADEGTSSLFRLKLGDGTTYRDAYCGNYGLHASGNVTYTAQKVVAGETKIDPRDDTVIISDISYNIIRAVVTANNAASTGSANQLAYTAGQLTIWRTLYLCQQGKDTYKVSTFINQKMKDMISGLSSQINPEDPTSIAEGIEQLMKDYLSAAKNGSYSEYPLYIWDDGNPEDQLLFTSGNIDTKEEHGYIELTKTSTYNGEGIGGATYGVYTNKNCKAKYKVDEFTTDDTGYGKSNVLTTKDETGTEYSFWVKEISCNENYEVSTKVYPNNNKGIKINNDGGTYTLSTAEDKKVQDDPISANLYVYKLNAENEPTATGTNSSGNKTYTDDDLAEVALSGATFVVDEWSESSGSWNTCYIMEYDSSTKRYNAKLYYSSDNAGRFCVRETVAPEGYILDSVPEYFNLSAQPVERDNYTNILANEEKSVFVYDKPICGSVELSKIDSQSGEIITGTTFKLQEYDSGSQSYIDYEENGNVATLSYENGVYVSGLLYCTETNEGKFRIVETATDGKHFMPEYDSSAGGYIVKQFVLTEYQQTISVSVTNDPLTVALSKKDITSGEEIVGATLQVISVAEDGTETVYEEWVSTKTPHVIDMIPLGNYILREILAPTADGYVKASDVSFTVKDIGISQQVTMYDDYTKVEIDKVSFVDGKPVLGAELVIYEAGLDDKGEYIVKEDGSYELGDEYARWVTDGTSYKIDHVPTGKYVLVENTAPFGYLVSEMVPFEVTESSEILKVEMVDKPVCGVIQFQKIGDAVTGSTQYETIYGEITRLSFGEKYLAGVEFTIYRDESLTDVVETVVTDENGAVSSSPLRYGTYYVKETKTPKGYAPDPDTHMVEITPDEENSPLIDVSYDCVNHVCGVQINLWKVGNVLTIDSTGEGSYDTEKLAPLAGVVFGIYTNEDFYDFSGENLIMPKGTLVGAIKTGDDGKASLNESLLAGKYYYQELATLDGYEIDNEKYEFEVNLENEDIAVFDLNKENPNINYLIKGSRVTLYKVDRHTGAALGGVEFALMNERGQLMGTYVTDDETGTIVIEDLPYGNYLFKELKAQDYYLLGEVVIPFTINGGSDLKLEVKATNERISLPALGLVDKDTALAINIIFIGVVGLVLVGVSFVIYWMVKKRKVVRQ